MVYYYHYPCGILLSWYISIITPVAWGDQNLTNVYPCTCRKRRLIIGYKLSNTTGLLYTWSSCMQCAMNLDSWALGCPGQVIYVPKADEFFFLTRTNGIPERRS